MRGVIVMKRYFIKQKLLGLCMIIFSVIVAMMMENREATFAVITIPVGLVLMFSKRKLLTIKDDEES